ncbi:hypothetical protein D3C85_885020 [compost metagenome]
MTWVQVISGWALGYFMVCVVSGCYGWEAQDTFWKGFGVGFLIVTAVLIVVTLALLANGWLPS